MDGILAVWKPEGWTSHDVVAKVRRLLKMKRIGHAGTLDPMVTGVLPLCLGRATRVVEYLQERPKAYQATIRLGIATDTEDMTGEIIERADQIDITKEQAVDVLNRFTGTIEQIPPMFSALKVNGKRLYEIAREGKTVERKPRAVHIYNIELLHTNLDSSEPEFTFSVECSKGTYIRTLCVDIGRALGVPASMAHLTRTMSGGITEQSCLTLEEIEQLSEAGGIEERLLSSDSAVAHMEKVVLDDPFAARVLNGQRIKLHHADGQIENMHDGQLIRLYNKSMVFLGVFQIDTVKSIFKPIKVFS